MVPRNDFWDVETVTIIKSKHVNSLSRHFRLSDCELIEVCHLSRTTTSCKLFESIYLERPIQQRLAGSICSLIALVRLGLRLSVVARSRASLVSEEIIYMLSPLELLIIGIISGVVTRTIVGGKAYGPVADALLGITGAFAADWVLEIFVPPPTYWANSALLTIWGAVALPLLAHFFARRRTTRRLHDSLSRR